MDGSYSILHGSMPACARLTAPKPNHKESGSIALLALTGD
jgi:hypothetical protein